MSGAAGVDDPAVAAILRWWDAERRDLPWRATRDPYRVLVSEVMSQQTQITRAVAYWERWVARWPDPAALAAASLADVLRMWDGLGYPRRARALHATAAIVAREGWPPVERLTELPGVGPYTAAALRCFAWEEPVLPPDVNVRRLLARRFPDGGVAIDGDPWRAGQALMEFGQRVCSARPRCGECVVADGCAVRGLELADPAPRAARQGRFEGSMRQRRGALLRRVLGGEAVSWHAADAAAAESLLADGLLVRDGDVLQAPEAGASANVAPR